MIFGGIFSGIYIIYNTNKLFKNNVLHCLLNSRRPINNSALSG